MGGLETLVTPAEAGVSDLGRCTGSRGIPAFVGMTL